MRAFPLVPLVAVLVAATASAERPALKVNDIVLTDTDLKLAEQLVVPQMQRQNPGARPSPQDVMKRIVDRLIGQTLLLQAAHEATITVDSADVKAEVDRQRTRSGAAG